MLTAALLAALAITGCNSNSNGKTDPGPGPSGSEWSSEIQEEMEDYLGEVIPFVQLETATMYTEWDDEEYGYFVGDESYTDLLQGYSSKLTGWEEAVDDDGYTCYVKENKYGETLVLYYDWYEASSTYPQGNEIAVYVITDSPVVSGNTIDFTKLGLENGTKYTEFHADGFDIEIGGGNSNGQYVTNNSGDSIRIYKDGSITITSDEPMKAIAFEWIKVSKSKEPTSSNSQVNTGTYNYDEHVWTVNSTEVVFTCNLTSNYFALVSITVSFE